MRTQKILTEHLDVRDVHDICLCIINTLNDLQIQQGDRTSLVVEAEPGVLARLETRVSNGRLDVHLGGGWSTMLRDALRTSLSRPTVRLLLQVRDLDRLELCGAYRVRAADMDLDDLTLKLRGPIDFKLDALTARSLTVQDLTVGSVELSGQVVEQRLTLSGMGRYQAANLKSERAAVVLKGPGRVTLWVVGELEADVRGPGTVEYRGRPKVRRRLAPLGRVAPLGLQQPAP